MAASCFANGGGYHVGAAGEWSAGVSIREAASSPCRACPWRTANHGKRHPDGWYTKANIRRLWAGMRAGEIMSCHPTDPWNPVSDAAEAAGYTPAPDHAETRECAGALILQQREWMAFQISEMAGGTLRDYRRARPRGLTRDGLLALVNRHVFGGTPFGGPPMARPDLCAPVSVPGADLPWPLTGSGEPSA